MSEMTTDEALRLFDERAAKHSDVVAKLRADADRHEKLMASGYFEAIRAALRDSAALKARLAKIEAAAWLVADFFERGEPPYETDAALKALRLALKAEKKEDGTP